MIEGRLTRLTLSRMRGVVEVKKIILGRARNSAQSPRDVAPGGHRVRQNHASEWGGWGREEKEGGGGVREEERGG